MAASTTYLVPVITKHLVVCPKCSKGHMEGPQPRKEIQAECGHCHTRFSLHWEGFNAPVRARELTPSVDPA